MRRCRRPDHSHYGTRLATVSPPASPRVLFTFHVTCARDAPTDLQPQAASPEPLRTVTQAPSLQLGAGEWIRVVFKATALGACTTAVVALLGALWLPSLVRRRAGPSARARIRRHWSRIWGRVAVRVIGVRVAAPGTPPPPGALVVSNHVSYLDILVLSSLLPVVFVAKAGLRRWPYWGFVSAVGGTVYIDRSKKRDVVGALAGIEYALGRGDGVVIFPEATTSDGSSMLAFKPSLLATAAARQSPVHWLTLSYSTPSGSPSARDRVCWWGNAAFPRHCAGLLALRRIDCTVRFGDAPVQSHDRKALAVALRTAMLQCFEPTCHEREHENGVDRRDTD